ncbi:hypothetical protein QBZ16_002659 [Prototheca wickerhamii]|uniref:TFIIS-type domain-containing protein n=1 Tax=Prototheca wickerhamii TaxID=3111 RepID=A0AAD9IKQ4_PROWI|nr:hypothetical protein QBZ16_002659 [Prototheca wickerhamii]
MPGVQLVKRVALKKKEVDDVLGGDEAWANVQKTDVTCPKCSYHQAYFMEIQIRSADEPATLFFNVPKQKAETPATKQGTPSPARGNAQLDLAAAIEKLTAEASAARAVAEEGARHVAEAQTRAADAAKERDRLASELAAERARAAELAAALERETADEASAGPAAAAAELAAQRAALEEELAGLRAAQAQRDAMVQEWAQEAAISCQLATSAAEAHAAVLADFERSQKALEEAQREIQALREATEKAATAEPAAAPAQELEAERAARADAESALATALEHLAETEEEAEELRGAMSGELEESGALLFAAEARLADLGRRVREAEARLREGQQAAHGSASGAKGAEAGAEADAEASAPREVGAADQDELRRLRDEPRPRAAAETDRIRAKLEAAERAQKPRGGAHSLLFGGWGRGAPGASEGKKLTLDEALERLARLEAENRELKDRAEGLDAVVTQSRAFIDATLKGLDLHSGAARPA